MKRLLTFIYGLLIIIIGLVIILNHKENLGFNLNSVWMIVGILNIVFGVEKLNRAID